MKDIKSVMESVMVFRGKRNMAVISKGDDMKLFLDVLVDRVSVVESEPINSRGVGELNDEDLNA